MQSFSLQQSAIDKILANTGRSSAIEKAVQSFASKQSTINKIFTNNITSSAIDKAMQKFASQQSIIENAIQKFSGVSHILINEPICISAMAEVIADIDNNEFISIDKQAEIIEKINESSNELGNAKDSQSFIQIFKKLPPILQVFLFSFLLHIVLPQVNSISANLLTPVVENFLNGNENSNRENIKEIKQLPLRLNEIKTDDLRFITGNNVHLRESPSTKSAILDEMRFGQVITILSKERNWIEIIYEYENSEILHGWVYTRYTTKFSR